MPINARIYQFISDDASEPAEEVPFVEWDFDKYPELRKVATSQTIYWIPSHLFIKPSYSFLNKKDTFRIVVDGWKHPQCNMTHSEYIEEVDFVFMSLMIFNEYLDPQNFEEPVQLSFNKHYYYIMDPEQYTYFQLKIRK